MYFHQRTAFGIRYQRCESIDSLSVMNVSRETQEKNVSRETQEKNVSRETFFTRSPMAI